MDGRHHNHHHHHHHHLHQHHNNDNHLNQNHELARRLAHAHSPLDLPPNVQLPSPTIIPDPSRLVARGDSPTSTCTDHTSPGCELPASVTLHTGTIIGVTVAIPLFAALVVLYLLHRRGVKRQAAEDVADAQKDLDYGFDSNMSIDPTKRGKKGATATVSNVGFEKEYRKGGHGTGVSIDLGNPYMLPPEMNGSRDSLHSLTRSLTDKQDPYRMVSQQTPSLRNFGGDAHSIRSASDRALLPNAAPNPLSRSASPLVPLSGHQDVSQLQRKEVTMPQPTVERVEMPTFDFTDHTTSKRPDSTGQASSKSVDVGAAKRLSDPNKSLPATPLEHDNQAHPPRGTSLERKPTNATNNAGPVDPFAFQEVVVPPSPEAETHEDAQKLRADGSAEPYDAATFPHPPPPEPAENRLTLGGLGLGLPAGNRLSILRPLPPDDPNDNPETRANRIRSFYKEYFADGDAHVHDASGLDYYEDYGDEYLQDGAVFDPETGRFIVAQGSHADPITRRAMTPPPRGPPAKFRSGPRHPGHASQNSSPGIGGPRGRAFSNASTSRIAGQRGRQGKRPLPPPVALRNLPTPHLLKEDAFNMTMDFAPPQSYRDRAAGRSESPFMDERPYAHDAPIAQSPLASSHTELAAVPSPHLLRKSGTFTALDFAPPPRFRDMDGASDAGSIRSGRSNFSAVSARQQHNIRAGAYRLSRVPKELVGTRDDLMSSLKPTWKMGN